jgi:hypothetical protein
MSRPAATSKDQLLLAGMEKVVVAAIEKAITGPKTSDPRRPLDKYPQRMTVAQVAAFLNCSENHVRNLHDCGELEGKDIAAPGSDRQTLRIFRESVAAFEDRRNLKLVSLANSQPKGSNGPCGPHHK